MKPGLIALTRMLSVATSLATDAVSRRCLMCQLPELSGHMLTIARLESQRDALWNDGGGGGSGEYPSMSSLLVEFSILLQW